MAKKKREEKDTSERYLVPYADLLTLMLAFFVVLYAMSEVDEKKMESLGDSFASAFNVSVSETMVGFESQTHMREQRSPATDAEISEMKAVSEQNTLRELKRAIDEKIQEQGLETEVSTNLDNTGLRIVLTNEILFTTASAELANEKSKTLIRAIGLVLNGIDNPISIEGHTDNLPINTGQYASNWELSSDRALTILKEMISKQQHLEEMNFSATGYAEFKPLAENTTEAGRSKNRRVEIVIKRINGENLMVPESEGK